VTKLTIEVKTLEEIINSMVLPAVLRYQTELAQNIAAMKSIGMESSATYQKETLEFIVTNVDAVRGAMKAIAKFSGALHHAESVREEAAILCNEIKPQMEIARTAVDHLESVVDDQYWPLVKYRELLRVH
jgi:glutamine synthetase